MGDIKLLLKEARKLIDEKKFSDAQECCKNILRNDKQNYFGLVLLGKSLQDSDQAPLAYQKAISVKPEHPLAWQGLANYYEIKDGFNVKSKLIQVYKEMLQLSLENDKVLEILVKIGQLGCSLKNNECISVLINYIIESKDEKLKLAAEKQLLELLQSDLSIKPDDISLILKVLNNIVGNDSNKKLLCLRARIIMQQNDFASALEEVMGMNDFSKNVPLREWLCEHLCKKYIEDGFFYDIEKDIGKIIEGLETSKYSALLQSIILYNKGFVLEGYKKCIPYVNYEEPNRTEALVLLNCMVKLKKWSMIQKLVTNFLVKVKDNLFTIELKRFLFLSLVRQEKWVHAITIAKEIPLENLNNIEKLALLESFIEFGENPEEHEIWQTLNYMEHLQLKVLYLLKQMRFNEVVSMVEKSNDSPLLFFYLGKAYWELQHFDKSFINFLKSAKCDPENSDTFFYLGHCYMKKNYYEKAKKCFEKAYNLNNVDKKIVKDLSELYSLLQLKENDFNLLVSAEKSMQPKETWLYFRLGLHYLNKRQWENAITNFRNVIKSNHDNVVALECLADAYYSRGSYSSALRAYNKVISMNPNKSLHCLCRIGYIYSLLMQYEDAIVSFVKVLAIDAFSLLALKGLAETWIRIAKKKVSAKLYGTARDCIQKAINYIMIALSKQKHYICFWKLLGDSLMYVTKLPNKFCYIFMKDNFNSSESKKKEKLDIFQHAITCYSQIAKMKLQHTSYDLASIYLAYYHETGQVTHCRISFNLAIACVKENTAVWRYWNLLGKISLFLKKYDIAQHCFIKALLVTHKWSVAKIWCNLGTLYLKLKHYKNSNYCFWRGQSTLPSYPQSWIGQALIAEIIREDEAMDLLRHASRLGYHPESALGYADWVCRTLRKNAYKNNTEYKYVIEGLYAINYSIDLLEWFLNFEPDNACACNMLGILQERTGLYRTALTSYEKALCFAENDKKNIILLNIGRILLRLEKYDEAVKIYKSVTEASLNSTCGLALALLKKGLYEESYSVYDTALHWLSNNDSEKADLLVAMAGIMYMFKGVDDAKTILFHSIQISQNMPSAFSLFSICSLGLIHSDESLTKLALSELKKFEKDYNFSYDIGYFKSYDLICKGNIDQAVKVLSDSLHDFPHNDLLWFCMAEYCITLITKPQAASFCAQKAICAKHYNSLHNFEKMIATASIAEHIAGEKNQAFTLAKKGLHSFPNSAEVWASLLLSLLAQKSWLERKDWIIAAAGYMRRHLKISRPLSRWVSLLEKKLST
ncbi:hypothetical protein ACJJTC_004350 [Scirpophaga incertulas]